MLSTAMSTELKECMLVLPQSAPAMGMMKPMPAQFREARDEMCALPADEQDELAATLAQEFDNVPAADRRYARRTAQWPVCAARGGDIDQALAAVSKGAKGAFKPGPC